MAGLRYLKERQGETGGSDRVVGQGRQREGGQCPQIVIQNTNIVEKEPEEGEVNI